MRIGFNQTDLKVDIVSYMLLQVIFCCKNRFFDWEKSLGQEKGLSITSNKYGFTSDRVSESDDMTSMNASMHQTAMELFAAGRHAMANTFVRSSAISGGGAETGSALEKSGSGDLAGKGTSSSPTTNRIGSEGDGLQTRRTKYSGSRENKTTKMNVLEMILPRKLASSFHSSQIPDDSGHNDQLDTSSKGLLGSSASSSSSRDSPFQPLNLLSGFSFDFQSPPSNKYSTLGSSGMTSVVVDSESDDNVLLDAKTPQTGREAAAAPRSLAPNEIKLKCASSDSYLRSESTLSVKSSGDTT